MITEIHKMVVYSKTPLKNRFRFENWFQIYPFELEQSPHSRHWEHFPLVLEYSVQREKPFYETIAQDDDQDFRDLMNGLQIEPNRILGLLSSTTNHHFFLYPYEGRWSFTLPIEGEKYSPKPTWTVAGGFQLPNSHGVHNQFSNISEINEVEYIERKTYFSEHPIDSKKGIIKFPDSISVTLKAYCNLNKEETVIANNSIKLINSGIELSDLSSKKSLSLVAFVSAIETIADYYFKKLKGEVKIKCNYCKSVESSPFECPECGDPVWAVSFKYRTFLQKVVSSGPEFTKRINKVYVLRSKIVHNGSLLLGDGHLDWGDLNNPEGDWFKLIETNQVARLALTHWILLSERDRILNQLT